MSDVDNSPNEVGYKNPPLSTRFRPGQSGNPRGRPKGSRNFSAVVQNELRARITVTENGKRRKISKREAVVKQLVNKAANGDPKAIPVLLNEIRAHEPANPIITSSSYDSGPLGEHDLQKLSDGELIALYRSAIGAS